MSGSSEVESLYEKKFFTIGEVADISGLSRKSLRYYDEKGLLSPLEHGENKYRYYSSEQVQSAVIISALKLRGFSFTEIRKLLENYPTIENIHEALDAKVSDLEAQVAALQIQLEQARRTSERIKYVVNTQPEDGDVEQQNDDCEISFWPERTVIYTRYESYFNAEQTCWWDRVAEIYKMCAESNYPVNGSISAIFHEHFLKQFFFDYGDLEVFLPVTGVKATDKNVKIIGGYTVASKIYRGPYRELLPVYVSLVNSIEAKGYKIAGPAMEEYLIEFTQGADEQNYITRVSFPIEKAGYDDRPRGRVSSDAEAKVDDFEHAVEEFKKKE